MYVIFLLMSYCFAFDFLSLQNGRPGKLLKDLIKISDQIFGSRTLQTK